MTATLATTALPSVRLVVVDCPAEAWAGSDQNASYELGREFYGEHQANLDIAASELIRDHLVAAWLRRGYHVRLVAPCVMRSYEPWPGEAVGDELRWAVWQEAADLIPADLLLFAAGLDGVFAEYRAGLPADEPDRDYDLAGDR